MHKKYVSKTGASRLILIYADWATDWHLFAGLVHDGYDIVVISNYSDLSFKWKPFFEYDEIVLIGWGFGVFIASITAHEIMPRVTLRIAVNGTLDPVSDIRGMHQTLFNKLCNSLTPSMLWQYWRRMTTNSDQYANLLDSRPTRTLSSLVDELHEIDAQLVFHAPPITDWDIAIVGRYDVIFPPENQRMAWAELCTVVSDDCGHLPDFEAIFNRFVVDKTGSVKSPILRSDAVKASSILVNTLYKVAGIDRLEGDVMHILVDDDTLFDSYLSEHVDGSILVCGNQTPELQDDKRIKFSNNDAESVMLRKASNSVMYIVGCPLCHSINSPKVFLNQCNRVLVSSGFLALSICDYVPKVSDHKSPVIHDELQRWIEAVPRDMDVFVNVVKRLRHNYLFLILRKL